MRISLSSQLLLFFLSIVVCLPAQQDSTLQQVIMTDGNVIRGHVLSEQLGDTLLIETLSGTVFLIPKRAIKKVIRIPDDQKLLPNGRTLNQGATYAQAFWGLLPGETKGSWQGDQKVLGYTILQLSFGHRFTPYLQGGLGMSWDQYEVTLFSLHAEIQGDIVQGATSPYYVFRGGYGFPLINDDPEDFYELKGGYVFHPAIGIRFATTRKVNWMVEVGYRFQQFQRVYEDFFQTKETLTNRRLAIRVGLDF